MMMNYNETKEFQKDFKKLGKKYRTLAADLKLFKKILAIAPLGNSKHFTVLIKGDSYCIIKTKFFCKSLRNNSLRIIYAYNGGLGEIELISIDFIELYFKGDKEREDNKRIVRYLMS